MQTQHNEQQHGFVSHQHPRHRNQEQYDSHNFQDSQELHEVHHHAHRHPRQRQNICSRIWIWIRRNSFKILFALILWYLFDTFVLKSIMISRIELNTSTTDEDMKISQNVNLPSYFYESEFFKSRILNDLLMHYSTFHHKSIQHYMAHHCQEKVGNEYTDSNFRGFIVFKPHGTSGMANVLLGLVSSFLLSLLTGKVFLVDWSGHTQCKAGVKDLFRDPNVQFKWDLRDLIDLQLEMKCANKLQHYDIKLELTHHRDGSLYMHKILKCNDFERILRNERVILISSNQYFVPLLEENPYFGDTVRSLFPHNNAFSKLSGFLFHPIDSVQQEIDMFLKRHHIQENPQNQKQNQIALFAIQVRRNEKEPDAPWFRHWHLPYFWNCFREKILPKLAPHRDYRILIISDNSTVRDDAREVFGHDKIIYYENQVLNFKRDKLSVQLALIDAWLFGYAEDGIVTKWSTFGNFAHGRAGLTPYVMQHWKGTPICYRQDSSEPDFHMRFRTKEIQC